MKTQSGAFAAWAWAVPGARRSQRPWALCCEAGNSCEGQREIFYSGQLAVKGCSARHVQEQCPEARLEECSYLGTGPCTRRAGAAPLSLWGRRTGGWGLCPPAPAPTGPRTRKAPPRSAAEWETFLWGSEPWALPPFLYLSELFKCVCGGERGKMSVSILEPY